MTNKTMSRDTRSKTDYDKDINAAERARDSQRRDSDPMIQKEGFLGMDDLDKMRRRKISKIF